MSNVPVLLVTSASPDVATLCDALRALPRRFPQLLGYVDESGTVLCAEPGELEVQVIEARGPAEPILSEISFHPFDLTAGPMARAAIVVGGAKTYVVLVLHHVVADARSIEVIVSALADHVAGMMPLEQVEPQEPNPFAASEIGEDTAEFWAGQLKGLPTGPSGTIGVGECRTLERTVGRTTRAWVLETARRLGVTPMVVVLAAWEVCLAELVDRRDHVVMVPVSVRADSDDDTVGALIETIPVVADAPDADGFDDLVRRTWARFVRMIAHPRVPFARLLNQPGLAAHLNQFLFSWQEATPPVRLGSADFEPVRLPRAEALFQLALECAPTSDGYLLRFEFRADGTPEEAAAEAADRLVQLLDPDSSGCAASWRPPTAELVSQALAWGRGAPNPVPGRSLLDLVLDAATERPDALAVVDDSGETSYRELVRWASEWRHELEHRGIGAGDVVGTVAPSSAALVAAWLATWSLGAAYVACDPAQMSERSLDILADAGVRLVVSSRPMLPGVGAPLLGLDAVPRPRGDAEVDRGSLLARPGAAEEVAYLVYTSGSTGSPKGVVVPHRAIARLIGSRTDLPIEPRDRVAQFVSTSFDVSAYEFWGALTRGATLVIPATDVRLDPIAVADFLRAERISCVVAATSVLNHWVRREPGVLDGVRILIFGGERAAPDVLATVAAGQAPPPIQLNIYGPSEAATAVSHHRVTAADIDRQDIPIGRPTAGADLTLLDDAGRVVAAGRPGELWISGPAVVAGYLHQPARSGFAAHPVDGRPSYRTGDLARWDDGVLRFLGRIDDQVKIRGMRIEPAEVEMVLRQLPDVSEGAVVVLSDPPALRAAYAGSAEPRDVTEELRRRLPGPMVPTDVIKVDVLPISANGKLDRRALRRLAVPARTQDPVGNDTEQLILRIWSDLLGTGGLGIDDDFFDVGGHSLLVAVLAERLDAQFGVRPGIAALMSHRTVRHQALLIEQPTTGTEPAAGVLTLVEGTGGGTLALFHPIGGTSGLYSTLAHSLTGGLRVLGLQAPGIAGECRPLETIEELAEHHLRELDRLGVEAPFLLGGISMGGSIAYEVARLSVRRGDPPPFVGLLDTPGPGQLPTLFDDDAEMLATIFAGGDADFVAQLRSLPPLEMFRRVLGAMAPEHAASLSARDLEIFSEVWRAHSRALLSYRPAPVDVGAHYGVHYYKAKITVPPHPEHPEWPWEALLGDRLRLTVIDGNHESIIERPHVGALARALATDINRFREAQA